MQAVGLTTWLAVPDGLVIASALYVPSLQEPTAMVATVCCLSI